MMKKEPVSLRKTEDFEEVDRILSEAMAQLDEANDRVGHMLSGEPAEESDAARAKATGQPVESDEAVAGEEASEAEDGAGQTEEAEGESTAAG